MRKAQLWEFDRSRSVGRLADEIAEWAGEYLEPEQVFSQEKLEAWAKSNDFLKQEQS